MVSILFENDDFLIADKKKGIPTVPLKTQSPEGTLLYEVAAVRPEVMSVKGKNIWECGALHRLDNPTSGLVVFAKKQSFFDYLSNIQNNGLFMKTYIAETIQDNTLKGIDIPEKCHDYIISSYFRSFGPKGSAVRPTQDEKRADSPRIYSTTVSEISSSGGKKIFRCVISKGFRHQIRSHLAWCGYPITGDNVYCKRAGYDDVPLQLDCFEVSFPLPEGRSFVFSKDVTDAII